MTEEEMETVARFMDGDTENMDIHEHTGEVLRAYIGALYRLTREVGGGSLTDEELYGVLMLDGKQ